MILAEYSEKESKKDRYYVAYAAMDNQENRKVSNFRERIHDKDLCDFNFFFFVISDVGSFEISPLLWIKHLMIENLQ